MNVNTGQIYPSMRDALDHLAPGETEKDVVEITGAPETIERLSKSVQQLREVERRRAANKAARAARKAARR